jgi:hypothetical protein
MTVPLFAASSTGIRVFPGTKPSSTAFCGFTLALSDDHPDAVVPQFRSARSPHTVAENGHRLALQTSCARLSVNSQRRDLFPHSAKLILPFFSFVYLNGTGNPALANPARRL